MHIGVLTLELHIHGAASLKDKRAVINSVLERIRNRFNVSAAQLDNHDRWQRATLAVAVVSNDRAAANAVLNHVRDLVEAETRCDVAECRLEFL
jgi:uncharacterized protein YlxP (DUF503 family)